MRTVTRTLTRIVLALTLMGSSACSGFATERLIYNQQDIRIGIETDPSVARSNGEASNDHPANVTTEELLSLLGAVQVSGWSGTFVGMFASPRPVPLFQDSQLRAITPYLAAAFHNAGATERVFFSLPNPQAAYSEDRTTGAILLRGRYLHIVVTDHASIIRADTGGGDPRDIRDTKGMKLWVAQPAQAATVPDAEEPRWAPFETVHISLNTKDVLAQRSLPSPAPLHRASGAPQPAIPAQTAPTSRPGSDSEDLQLQIRELTSSNLELRGRLEEQKSQMHALTEEMNRLRREIENAKAAKPPQRKQPSP